MKELRYTLTSDGSSDRALIPILNWLLMEYQVKFPIQAEWADLRRIRRNPPRTLSERIKWSLDLYPCDLLFVHRDAEKTSLQERAREIQEALQEVAEWRCEVTVCVIPVRMMEAWLLLDEKAIRRASGNPHGQQSLRLPPHRGLERLPNPKQKLHELLRQASGFKGRRRKSFSVLQSVQLIPEFMDTFMPLRVLPAFRALEKEMSKVIQEQGWA